MVEKVITEAGIEANLSTTAYGTERVAPKGGIVITKRDTARFDFPLVVVEYPYFSLIHSR
jgi:hypothetical protein